MARPVAFGPRAAAEIVSTVRADRARTKNPTDPHSRGAVSVSPLPIVVRVTSTIPARSDTTPGSGDVDLFLLGPQTDGLQQNEAESTVTAYNLGGSAIEGTEEDPVYALAVQVRGGGYVLIQLASLCELLAALSGASDSGTQFLRRVDGACPSWIGVNPTACEPA